VNFAHVCRILGFFALAFTGLQAAMLGVALLEGEAGPIAPARGFAAGVGAGLLASVVLFAAGRSARGDVFRREGLAVVGCSWLLAGLLGGIPFVASGALATLADGVFETISGLTTTGASVCGAGGNHAIEDIPGTLLFWRSFLQWLGGLGIILVFLVVLPHLGVTGGKNLLDSEAVGVGSESSRPRVQEQARLLLRLYAALTVAEAVLLYGPGGMSWFDAVCHAFTTMATGGFSTRNASIGAYDSAIVEGIVIVFMFLAGANFPLMLRSVRNARDSFENRQRQRRDGLLASPEFRLYTAITVVSTAIVALSLWLGGRADGIGAVRHAAFQVVSILTSTGYATANFQTWPALALLLLWFCMFVGGSTGSTAGGYKVLRVLIGAKLVGYAIRKYIRPNSVSRIKLGTEPLTSTTISSVMALLLLWIACVAAGALVLALDGRLDLVSALTASQSMMSCTGPAMTAVLPDGASGYVVANAGGIDLGPYGSFGALSSMTKLALSFQMILGRLEILAPLVLFVPTLWRR
jgi:trk system potassium uptake protein TrkH